jgi:hypothetical protein
MRMPTSETQRRMMKRRESASKWLAVVCALVVWTSGCVTRKAPKPHVAPITFDSPVVHASTDEGMLEAPPDITVDQPVAPSPLVTSRSAPAKPHVAPAPEPAPVEKTAEPTIVPEVPTGELLVAKAETQRNLDLAEKNLTVAAGKALNATQSDLMSKVRGFTDNAREAMRSGDWVRAKNLSKKAEVLSEQLAASL